MLETHEKQTPYNNISAARAYLKNLYDHFWPNDQRCQKYVHTEKCPLVEELKIKT